MRKKGKKVSDDAGAKPAGSIGFGCLAGEGLAQTKAT
jgi:hypothetical protein